MINLRASVLLVLAFLLRGLVSAQSVPPPSIVAFSGSQTVTDGTNASFTVVVNGALPFSYQWHKDGNPISGATANILSFVPARVVDSGSYTVAVTNAGGTVTSSSGVLTVRAATPPQLSFAPAGASVYVGAPFNLSVTFVSSTPMAYEWKRDGVVVASGTSNSFSKTSAQPGDAGSYTATATNATGSTTSSAMLVTVLALTAPVITTAPRDQTTASGGSFSFSVSNTTGGSPVTYQWSKDGVPLSGATSESYGRTTAIAADAGLYTVAITNAQGTVVSIPARLTVTPGAGPSVSVSSLYSLLATGGEFSLNGYASGAPPITYQWFKDGALLSGETRSNLSRSAVSPVHAGSYTLVATNADGSAGSAPYRIRVESPRLPEILAHPGSRELTQGDFLDLAIQAAGSPPLTYQWNKDGALIAGATNNRYTASRRVASSDSGLYTVTVTNPYGSVRSEAAQINVGPTPTPAFTLPLTDRTGIVGSPTELNVRITTEFGLTNFVWKKGDTVLTNSDPVLMLRGLATDAGDYSVTASTASGSVTSSAKVTMLPEPPLTFTTQPPAYISLLPEDSLNFDLAVSASDWNPVTYQWYRDGVAIPGATNRNYFTPRNSASLPGTYNVVAATATRTATSADVVVTIDSAAARPAITYTGGSQILRGEQSATIRIVTATAATIQWRHDGVDIPNATSPTLSFASVTPSNIGTYTAVVTTAAGTVTSRPIVLSLVDQGVAPLILQPPRPQTVFPGSSIQLSPIVSGEAPLTYQWRKDGTAIPGATHAFYDLNSIIAAHAGKYSVTVTNRHGTVTTADSTVAVFPETTPVIYRHPASQLITASHYLALSVEAGPSFGASYQWWKDGAALPGATNASYQVGTVATAAHAGRYSLVVRNSAGSVRSREALVALGRPSPVVPSWNESAFPDQTVATGTTLALTSNLTDATTYQWRRDGVDLPGATAATLLLANLQPSESGTYVAFGTNTDGVAPGMVTRLVVQPPSVGLPRISTSPLALTLPPGNTATFTAGVSANPTATYQWSRNSTPLAGATALTLTIPNISAANAGSYTLTATNSFGSVTSAGALLTVGASIAFTRPPLSQTLATGTNFQLTAAVQSSDTVTYQWKKNGTAIPGATTSTLTFNGGTVHLSDAGTYILVATAIGNSLESPPATLTVTASPFAGTYGGAMATGDAFAVHVSPDGLGDFIGTLTTQGEALVGRAFNIAADGTFTFATSPRIYGAYRVSGDTVTGRFNGSALTGLITGRGISFTGQAHTLGATASLAGYYAAVPTGGPVGEVHLIAAPDGSVQLLAITPAGFALARGSLTPAGSFSHTLQFHVYAGTLAANGTIAGTFQTPTQPTLSFTTAPTVGGPERLANVSARGIAGSDSRALIAGFVVSGTVPKDVLIRAVGPALTGFGVAGALANPRLKLFQGGASLLENDDWGLGGFATQIATTTARVGGFPFAVGSQDSALIVRLDPGSYSAQVTGSNAASGVALVEVYDAGDTPNATRLINLSTRGEVGTDGNILIVGVVVTGTAPKKILLRGIGPGLAAFGVPGTLVDPQLKLFRGSQLLRENDNWSTGPDATLIAEAAKTIAAFALSDGSKDAALLLYLAPGTYSAQLSGASNTTGVGLVEVYEVP